MQFAVAAVHFAGMEACWSFGWKPVAFSATMKTRTSRETPANRLAESLLVTWLEACGLIDLFSCWSLGWAPVGRVSDGDDDDVRP